ncbi:nonsense-mediated mRNA decay factor SMG7-like isoform X3 [Eriocheir sinensis]|uniref:nonsense-mediated mRNA decay factor SMG7-like isoform X3 n=1 Tax=Eriocheir sinensis TaxID=95602 RepID=UPI0021C789D5|nr:nonsense-mediated mRNA decay factor SMG7-like isoform X3 [Eriocheir sinensis]
MKTASQLLREAEGLKSRLSSCSPLVGNNEAWAVQHQLQVVCGQLLVHWIEAALDQGVERDLWNLGFRNTIAQLQAQAKDKQGGSNEARDLLGWFLNSASGFYLQLLNQICSEYGLDLPFRRKDSIYGVVDLNISTQGKSKASSQKNALYLCQYCLVHLGDLARYRHQAKQAETYYRHAVTVAPTSGHPYNQLALLEAGRGNRLAAVALYVRAMCVPCPFPGAPANLTQTLTKVLASCSNRDLSGSSRVTGEEYTNLFLQCHAQLYLHGDAINAQEALPTLCSALSTLVATNAFTRTSLIQMVVVNLFALSYFLGKINIKTGEEAGGNKDEEKRENIKGHDECLKVVEELAVGVLAALLLPVHTIRDPDQLMTYPALPAVHLLFEWVKCEQGMLRSDAMKKKQQIWPGLCTLVNNLQQLLKSFSATKYADVPLTEDWDLQGFEPLQRMLNKYKYREGLSRLSPEEYNCLRASRLTDVAMWFTEQIIDGNSVIRVCEKSEGGVTFEAMQNSNPPVDEVRALEQLSLHPKCEEKPSSRRGKVGILKPQGSLERARETRDQQDSTEGSEKLPKGVGENEDLREKGQHYQQLQLPTQAQQQSQPQQQQQPQDQQLQQQEQQQQQGTGAGQPRAPRTRTNVALQAIMKRNSAMQEAKQVTFRTPSPTVSPNPSEASSDSHRSQLSTPPLLTPTFQRDPLISSPMPPHHGQIFQMGLPQGHGNSLGRQNQGNDNNFSNQQHFGGPPPWGGVGVLSANLSSQSNIQRPLLQPNPLINTNVNFKGQSSVSGNSQNILQQLQSSKGLSDMSAGIFSRPSMEGFHQLGGPVPPRPTLDITNRMREPGPRMMEMMGMTHSLPSFGHAEGLSNTCRIRPPGTEAMGLDSSHMNQVPFRGQQEQQDIDKNGSQGKMNPVTHSVFTSSAMNSHPYGMECRQNISGTNGSGMSGPGRSGFGDDVGPSRGPGLGWGAGQSEGKNYPVIHPPPPPPPPPTLANLLQQQAHVDMRLGLPGDHGTEQLNPGLARLSAGHSVHTSTMSSHSSPSIGSLGAVHLGMLPMPSSQPPRPAPHSQLPRGQHFLQEGGEGEGPSGNTYSLFSPMSGSSMGMGTGPSRTVPHPLYPSASQPSGQQSLWSGPGPSPLERLLEQKKYSSVPK